MSSEVLMEALTAKVEGVVANMGRRGDDGIRPMPLSLFLAGTLGVRAGSASDGVLMGSLTPQAVGKFFMLDADVPTYVDDTTDINDADAGDVLLMPATEAGGAEGTGDEAIVGHPTKKFCAVKLQLSTAGVGGTIVAEYYNGTARVNLATAHYLVDSSAGYTAGASTYFITFAVPTDWALETVNAVQGYFIHFRVATVYSTNPAVTRAWLLTVNDGVGITSPVNGEIQSVDFNALTVSGAADSVFQLINLSTGKTALVSFTQAVASQKGAVVIGGLAVNQGDSLVLMQISSHATAAANMTVILGIN